MSLESGVSGTLNLSSDALVQALQCPGVLTCCLWLCRLTCAGCRTADGVLLDVVGNLVSGPKDTHSLNLHAASAPASDVVGC